MRELKTADRQEKLPMPTKLLTIPAPNPLKLRQSLSIPGLLALASVACVSRVRPTHHSPLVHHSLKLAPWYDSGKGAWDAPYSWHGVAFI
jgi:hypothetical protein